MKEIFKPIKGYEDTYEVSNLGNIKSITRIIYRNGRGKLPIKERILKPYPNTAGYLTVNFRKDGKRKSYLVHRLVAEAFIPNPENHSQVNHMDKNRTNNAVDNLQWCTPIYNVKYSRDKQLYQYDLSGNLINEWKSVTAACKTSGFTASSISLVCSGKLYQHKGYVFSYVKH